MAQESISVPIPFVIKEEVLSDSEEVHCRLCHKAFASPVALNNHARMDHVEAYQNGDPTAWTKSENDPVVKSKTGTTKKAYKCYIQRNQKPQIVPSKTITRIANPDSDEVYILMESEDGKTTVTKKKQRLAPPKRAKATQAITGPFECLEPSPQGADGTCHQIFFSCCAYSAHGRAEHARRRRAARCQVCERPLPNRPNDPNTPYACEVCGEGYANPDELQEHINNFHVKLKPFECGVCHKRFTQQGGVLQHMRMHTGDRPFPCTFCTKSFTQKSGLDQHIRTHTKIKPYKCVICSKAFIQSVHVKQHMRTHTNVAPFQCGICEKRFKQSSHLNYHLKNHNPQNMTTEQQERYKILVRQMAIPGEVEVNEVEVESQEEVPQEEDQEEVYQEDQDMEEAEQVLAEQTLIEGDTYIIGDNYED